MLMRLWRRVSEQIDGFHCTLSILFIQNNKPLDTYLTWVREELDQSDLQMDHVAHILVAQRSAREGVDFSP